MKQILLVTLMLLAGGGYAAAQAGYSPSTDVLGAHLNAGRGCTACHSPHSGSNGNGSAKGVDTASGNVALWGEDVTNLYGKTITTDGGKYVEVLPTSMSSNRPDVAGMLTCLSCHDGNYGAKAMMRNRVYETLPSTYGNAANIPTLLGNSGGSTGNYLSEHPVGLSATVTCSTSGWDCTESNGVITMKGARSSKFVSNYGFFIKLGSYNNQAVVMCTTCHDQHSMNVVQVNSSTASGLPTGNYPTMFYLRGPYNPADTNPQSNQTAQFCRQCHGNMSNEMSGSSAGTIF